MALPTLGKVYRFVRNVSVPVSTFLSFSCMLIFIFTLYQPTPGPGIIQRLGWQSWDVISASQQDLSVTNSTTPGNIAASPAEEQPASGVEWWNVTDDETVDSASLPLDVWAPLLPHDTGFSEIAVTHCYVNPRLASVCDPDSTSEKDAILGKWVRVDRNLNYDGGYLAGYLNIYYRRTRRQDVNLITDIKLYPDSEPPPSDEWKKVPVSLRSGISRSPPLYLWYRLGKTSAEMTPAERSSIITELDVLYGDDIPWYGFEKLEPATMLLQGNMQSAWLTMRRGVKLPPRAPPLHFSYDGHFKILQIADLHYSVAAMKCKDTPPSLSCTGGSDNLTSTSLIAAVLSIEKPNLVVFTGDQLDGQGTSWDPKSVIAKFSREVANQGIPWAVVFGNHDEETGYVAAKEDQVKMMQALPYCLVERGPKDIHGVGNYVLKVKSADASKTHLLTLYFLDSGSYSRGWFDFWGWFTPTAYDWIRQNQIDWFLQESASINQIERPFTPDNGKDFGHVWERQSSDQLTPQTRKLAKPNAMMFFHIPLPETYNPPDVGASGRVLDLGISDLEDKGTAKGSDDFFTKGLLGALETEHVANKVKEVKVVGNGHCHVTENCRRVQGVWFCFGGGGSYSGYGRIGFDRRFRIYDISDYGETIRTYKRTEHNNFQDILDDIVLVGAGART
ncbi:Metallo-dependent phosphatase-like protein [Mycena pura]|uniref:Metallo-dependent phosphatase-like protein n=1 Tax=Mycena pura TaxID=153505 RepID=A0AAD6YMX4_9AGAR|nr:Metallo-dependent phosphatase-like protein [Mycena pura]